MSSNSHVLDRVHNAGKGQAPQTSGSNQNSTDQNHINTQILAQLNALGARLDSMENSIKTVKKTNDSTKLTGPKSKLNVVSSKGVGAVSPVQTVHNIPPINPSCVFEIVLARIDLLVLH